MWGQILLGNCGLASVGLQHPPVYQESWGQRVKSQARLEATCHRKQSWGRPGGARRQHWQTRGRHMKGPALRADHARQGHYIPVPCRKNPPSSLLGQYLYMGAPACQPSALRQDKPLRGAGGFSTTVNTHLMVLHRNEAAA